MPRKHIVTRQSIPVERQRQAQQLRSEQTPAERALWQVLRANRLGGLHFRRQQIVAGYIVDFYCHGADLVIEVDGPIHQMQGKYDQRRQTNLEALGLHVLRFSNQQVLENLPAVRAEILDWLDRNMSPRA